MRTLRFFWVSQLGMHPGTIVQVNAGAQLGQIETLSDIFSPKLILSFVLLGIFPLLARTGVYIMHKQRQLKDFPKPNTFDYNVIGAGSAGLVSSYIAAATKAKVALIEKHQMGGDCLNTVKKFRIDYSIIPWCTFTDPEVAQVGMNENEAKQQNIEHEVTVFKLVELDRAIAKRETDGWIKIITRPGKDKILGDTIVGPHAGDLIAEYILAMKHGIGLNKIFATIHPYPTLAEANKMAAGEWKKAHVPGKILAWMERFHTWRRT